MRSSIKKGFSFGITSAVITTLGLMIGLYATVDSTLVVISGILMIAIADSMSDALGVHIAEESENNHSQKDIWRATISTLVTKFVFTVSFIVSFAFFSLPTAIIVNLIWGAILLISFSVYLAILQKEKIVYVVGEHLAIAVAVIVAGHYAGLFLHRYLG